ncbi:MAG: Gx transporter family protein [Ruminococcaceae bacterium]|nr:Gx transporter family protein [Oscillospiraceae bacterium]
MKGAKRITFFAICVAISVALTAFEMTLPIITSIPGGKLGLANVVFLFVMYKYGCFNAFIINILRTFVVSFLFTGANAFAYSFFGAFISSIVMILLFKTLKDKMSPIGISVFGAYFHSLAQVTLSAIQLWSFYVYYYFITLSFISIVSGIVTGFCAKYFIDFTKGDILK